jgi:predicted PurR-regulated permease PerM
MILYYKPLLLEFIARLFKKEKHHVVAEVLQESKGVIQSYLYGLLIEVVIIATLNSIGLLILGVRYALLLGILGAILNIIPYIGGAIALALPVIMAFATQSTATGIWVIVVYTVIQFFDNNFIVPKIVASKVRMNALISLIVVLVGGALWGIPGMFLSIPIAAICKVIFDRVESLSAFGFLIGDNQPDMHKVAFKVGAAAKKEAAKSNRKQHQPANS